MMHIVAGQAQDPTKMKLRIVLHDPADGMISEFVRGSLLLQLDLIRKLVADNSAMDRGHKHSNGISEISIWIKCVSHAEETSTLPPPPAPPPIQFATSATGSQSDYFGDSGSMSASCGDVRTSSATLLDPWWQGSDPWAQPVAKKSRVEATTQVCPSAAAASSPAPPEDHASDSDLAWYHIELDKTFASLASHRQSLLNGQKELGNTLREHDLNVDQPDTLRGLMNMMTEYIGNHNQMVKEAEEHFGNIAGNFSARGLTFRCPAEALEGLLIRDDIL